MFFFSSRRRHTILQGDWSSDVCSSDLVFILFYGLDWVATVPPTVALCREYFGASGPVVFGWVFASHQVGAAFAATAAGVRSEERRVGKECRSRGSPDH